jgi:hypothetical protein
VGRSKYRRGSKRSAKILTTVFSIVVVLSVVLSLVGTFLLRDSGEPPPPPTRVIPTRVPLDSPTPSAIATTPTAGIPTPVLVTPTARP